MYRKIFDKAFSNLSPLTDSKVIISNTIERTKNMKTTETKKRASLKKPVTIAAAIVFGVTAATVSVGAATGWNFNEAFNSIFRQRTEVFETTPDYQEYKADFDFEKYGKGLDLHYSFDDYSLNIKGVIADESTAYIVYDVVFDKDYDYGEKDRYTPWEMKVILETADKAMHTNGGNIISIDDNRFTFYQMATGSTENKTLAGNTLVIDFYGLIRGIENSVDCDALYSEEQALDCGLTVEIPIDFPLYKPRILTVPEENSKANLIDWKNGKEINVEAKLETISLSPLSCDFSFMTGIATEKLTKGDCYDLGDFSFTDTDGNETIFSNNSYSIKVEDNGRMRYHVHLTQPIEHDEITSVTIGGATIKLD